MLTVLINPTPTQTPVKSPVPPHQRLVFGKDVQELAEIQHQDIPTQVREMIQYIEEYGIKDEGLFKLPGDKAELQHCLSIYNSDIDSHINFEDEFIRVHTVGDLLQTFFKELPNPLILDYGSGLLKAMQYNDESAKIDHLREAIYNIPGVQKTVFLVLLSFFHQLVKQTDSNKHTPDTLAAIWGPILLGSTDPHVTQVLTVLIDKYEAISTPKVDSRKEDIDENVSKLTESMKVLQKQVDLMKDEKTEKEKKLKEKYHKKKKELEKLQHEIADRDQQIKAFQLTASEMDVLNKQLAAQKEQYTLLQAKFAQSEVNESALRIKLAAVEQQRTSLEQKIATMNDHNAEDLKKEKDVTEHQMQQLKSFERQVKTLAEELETEKKSAQSMQSELTQLKEREVEANKVKEAQHLSSVANKTDEEKPQKQLETLEKELSALKTSHEALMKAKESADSAIAEKDQAVQKLMQEKKSMEESNQKLKSEVETKQAKIKEMETMYRESPVHFL